VVHSIRTEHIWRRDKCSLSALPVINIDVRTRYHSYPKPYIVHGASKKSSLFPSCTLLEHKWLRIITRRFNHFDYLKRDLTSPSGNLELLIWVVDRPALVLPICLPCSALISWRECSKFGISWRECSKFSISGAHLG
jgi:hypothetical protein